MPEGRVPLSRMLIDLCEDPRESIAIGDIVDSFGRRAIGALLFVFSVPNLLPLPPGSSSVLGLPLVLLAPQAAIGLKSPLLPGFVRRRELKTADLAKVLGRLIPYLQKIEHLSSPRLFMLFGPIGDRLIGIVCTLLSLVLILPIPLGNLAPAFTIGAFALALFQRDGVIALIGYASALVSTGLLVLSASAVTLALRKIMDWLAMT